MEAHRQCFTVSLVKAPVFSVELIVGVVLLLGLHEMDIQSHWQENSFHEQAFKATLSRKQLEVSKVFSISLVSVTMRSEEALSSGGRRCLRVRPPRCPVGTGSMIYPLRRTSNGKVLCRSFADREVHIRRSNEANLPRKPPSSRVHTSKLRVPSLTRCLLSLRDSIKAYPLLTLPAIFYLM